MKTVKKVFDALKLLAKEPERAHLLREIADTLNMNVSTCNVLLKSLVKAGAAEQKHFRQGYSLGPLVFYLSRNGNYRKDISDVAEKFLNDYTKKTGETILLSIFHHNHKKRIVLSWKDGNHEINVRRSNLFLEDLYFTASGRLLTAYLPPAELNAVIKKYGYPQNKVWKGAHTKKGFEKTLEDIRQSEKIIIENTQQSLALLAFPVWQGDKAVAVVGSHIPLFRFLKKRKTIISELQKTSKKISEALTKTRGDTCSQRKR